MAEKVYKCECGNRWKTSREHGTTSGAIYTRCGDCYELMGGDLEIIRVPSPPIAPPITQKEDDNG